MTSQIKIGIRILPLLLIALCIRGYSQEIDYTQYYTNLPAMNPAFTGVEDFLDLKMAFREGWNGLPDRNDDVYLSAYGVLGHRSKSMLTSNSLRISDPSAYSKKLSSKPLMRQQRRRHGLGAMVTARAVGPYESFRMYGNYAYHIPISHRLNWSLGTVVGYSSQRMDFSDFTVRDEVHDQFYQQLIKAGSGSWNVFSADFGSVLYGENFYFGISSQGLVRKEMDPENPFIDTPPMRYVLETGGTTRLAEEWQLNGGVLVTYSNVYSVGWGAHARVRYKDVVYVGAGFQSDMKASLMLGATWQAYSLNYAYDQYLGGLESFNVSAHELVVGIALFNRYSAKRRQW